MSAAIKKVDRINDHKGADVTTLEHRIQVSRLTAERCRQLHICIRRFLRCSSFLSGCRAGRSRRRFRGSLMLTAAHKEKHRRGRHAHNSSPRSQVAIQWFTCFASLLGKTNTLDRTPFQLRQQKCYPFDYWPLIVCPTFVRTQRECHLAHCPLVACPK